MGMNPDYDGLHISPAIPTDYEYMGMKDFSYGGRSFDVKVFRNGNLELNCKEGAGMDISLKNLSGKDKATVQIFEGDALKKSFEVSSENGLFSVKLSAEYSRTVCRVVIDQTI